MTQIVCISGQSWISTAFWHLYYAEEVTAAFILGAHFLVGAQEGVDRHAQMLLADLCAQERGTSYDRVTVVLPDSEDVTAEEIESACFDKRFALVRKGTGYKSRDEWMVKQATKTIIHLSPIEGGVSGCLIGVLLGAGFTMEQAKKAFEAIRKAHIKEDKEFSRALHKASDAYYAFKAGSSNIPLSAPLRDSSQ
jgi:hypothetical protein